MTTIIMNSRDNVYSAKRLYWRLPVFFCNQPLRDLITIKASTKKILKRGL